MLYHIKQEPKLPKLLLQRILPTILTSTLSFDQVKNEVLCLKSCFKNDRFSRILRKNYWGKKSLISASECYPNFSAGYNFYVHYRGISTGVPKSNGSQHCDKYQVYFSLITNAFRGVGLGFRLATMTNRLKKSQNMSAISVQIPIFILIVMAKLSNRPIGNFLFALQNITSICSLSNCLFVASEVDSD